MSEKQQLPEVTENKQVTQTNLSVKEILEMKEKIEKELAPTGIPDMKFLLSDEVVDNAVEILKIFIKDAKKGFEDLLEKPIEQITFDDLDWHDHKMSMFYNLLSHKESVDGVGKIVEVMEQLDELYIEYSNLVSMNSQYFDVVSYVYENGNLNEQQKRLLEISIRNMKLAGVNQPDEIKNKIKDLNKQISKLGLKYENNIKEAVAKFSYVFPNDEYLQEMPKDILEKAKNDAKEKGEQGYMFGGDASSVMSILKYCSDSNVRKHFNFFHRNKASSGKFDNRQIALDLLDINIKKSELLGFDTYGDFSLVKKMATSPKQVIDLLESLNQKSQKKSADEIEELRKYFGLNKINSWDAAYYSRKYKEEKFGIDDKFVREHFELENVLNGLFEILYKLFGVEFFPVQVNTYNEDVRYFEVKKDNEILGYYLLDPFYREGKRAGAWAEYVRGKEISKFGVTDTFAMNCCNFKKSDNGKVLLTYNEVTTLFHEMGHALHKLVSIADYSSLGGFGVEWDFVELPSQIMEKWAEEKEGLAYFAKHYETGELLSEDIIDKLVGLLNFNIGIFYGFQTMLGLMDMKLYTGDKFENVDQFDEFIKELFDKYTPYQGEDFGKMQGNFSHIFAGGYSAGYYSYLWADIIVESVFEEFKKNGIFDKQTAQKFYDTMLSMGTLKPADELFQDFKGEELSTEAFVKAKGF